ncbi:hypothetical protein Tco_0777141, partial [Tanacetum coccineum]
ATAKVKIVNGEVQIQALVDKKKVIIIEISVRNDLQLEDAEGTKCLPNATIFEQLTPMRYENLTQKFTFYKAFFSPQWKFLIHTILQCLNAKTTVWNEFSSTMDSAVICLATNQKFNFSKYIFDNMVKNLEGGVKILMYPRVGRSTQVVSSKDEGLGVGDAPNLGRKITIFDAVQEVTLVDEALGRNDDCWKMEKMPLEQFQVNTKFLNTLPDEWSKFVTDVKLVKDLHTTNVDQFIAQRKTT